MRRNALLVLFTIILLYALTMTTVRAEEMSNDLQMWNTVTLTLPVTKKIDAWSQFQIRNDENISHLDRTLLWAGLNYKLTPHLSVGGGYAWTPTYPDQPGNRLNNENRPFQQIQYSKPIKGGQLQLRGRVEERLIENTGTSVWTRELVQYSHPIKQTKFYWVISDEIFINLNTPDSAHEAGFDQNRVFAGLGRKLNPHANLELGYMGAYINKNALPNQWSHIIFTQLLIH